MIIPHQAASNVVQCSSHPHPPRPLLPPKREKGSQDRSLTRLRSDSVTRLCSGPAAWSSEAVRGVRMTHAKKQRRKENKNFLGLCADRNPDCSQLPFSSQGRRRGRGMRWGNTRSLCFANSIGYEKSHSWLAPPVRVVLREAVLVLEPTAIVIATMNDRS